MKRRASRVTGVPHPAKMAKESTTGTISEQLALLKREDTQKMKLEPLRLSSARERKTPSWLSSYVTTSSSSQGKALKTDEQPKHKIPRFPTLIPPSKRGKEDVKGKEVVNGKEDVKRKEEVNGKEASKLKNKSKSMSALRKQKTMKVTPSSPPIVPKRKDTKALVITPSLSKKPTQIIKSNGDSSASEAEPDPKKDSKVKTKKETTVVSKSAQKNKLVTRRLRLATSKSSDSISPPLSSTSRAAKKSTVSHATSKKDIKEEAVNDSSKVVEICTPSEEGSPDVTPELKEDGAFPFDSAPTIKHIPVHPSVLSAPMSQHKATEQTMVLNDQQIKPSMLEVAICISTSGALREYLSALQDHIREIIWKLQSLVPNLRIGVMAHTQGGIHEDQTRGGLTGGDHNYNRTGGHSGTKWLDLGATLSQICAFVDSLESEHTIYPDYVQDNLEMALWKVQRCMSWSSCSYRSVIMIGRGRPNRTTFYHQKEHWRGWIRSALELPPHLDIPIIDWELEAKFLAEMAIHVFTIQAVSKDNANCEKEDEGTCFFRRVADITQGQHVRIMDASKLPEILIGICCACHGSEMLLGHRDSVRDDNDGVLPSALTQIFVGLQLHSKMNSLSSLPSMLRNLDLSSVRQRSSHVGPRLEQSMDCKSLSTLESSMEVDSLKQESSMDIENSQNEAVVDSRNSRGKTFTSLKSVKNTKLTSSVKKEKLNGFKLKEKVLNSQRKTKPYSNNSKGRKNTSEVIEREIIKGVKLLNGKGKKEIAKKVKPISNNKLPNKTKENSVKRNAGKRRIKMTEKARENLTTVKGGKVSKAKDRKPVTSPLKKETIKRGLKSQDKTAVSSRVAKLKVAKAEKVTKSKQQQQHKMNGKAGRKSVGRPSPGGRNSIDLKPKGVAARRSKERFSKVSPLKRKTSAGKSALKTSASVCKKKRV